MSSLLGQTRLAYTRTWHHVSIPDDPRTLGRLASAIAIVLMGKHKPNYDPSQDMGDYVVASGCSDIFVSGKKMTDKKYYSHTTRPGSLKVLTMEKLMEKKGGGEILRRAVSGMLPKNRLRDKRLARLKTFETNEHPHTTNIVKFNYTPKQLQSYTPVQDALNSLNSAPTAVSQ